MISVDSRPKPHLIRSDRCIGLEFDQIAFGGNPRSSSWGEARFGTREDERPTADVEENLVRAQALSADAHSCADSNGVALVYGAVLHVRSQSSRPVRDCAEMRLFGR